MAQSSSILQMGSVGSTFPSSLTPEHPALLHPRPCLPKIWKQSSSRTVRPRACPTSDLSKGTAWIAVPFEVSPCSLSWPVWPGALSPSLELPAKTFCPAVLAGLGSAGPGVTGTPSKMSSVSFGGFTATGFSELEHENTEATSLAA